jgi:NTP pyrophosphatase (non-canonical NTP hydrolase)
MEELGRARAKFPTSAHRTLALMEEAGEVVKAALDLHNRKPGATLEALHTEIIQTMAMCVRLLEEGDPTVLGGVE